jgi:hypothetical protein
VQASQTRTKLSNAEENTRKLGKAVKQIRSTELAADIDALNLERTAQIEALALKHHQKPAHILGLINSTTHYKKSHAPTLQNALAHHKAVEMNKGMSPSQHIEPDSPDSIKQAEVLVIASSSAN